MGRLNKIILTLALTGLIISPSAVKADIPGPAEGYTIQRAEQILSDDVFVKTDESTELNASGACGDKLNWEYDPSKHKLIISGSGEMYDYDAPKSTGVNENTAPWQSIIEDKVSLTISEGVTSIGCNAFYGCDLKSVSLPDSLRKIGDYAFADSRLTKIKLPSGLTELGDGAFMTCARLKSINLPGGLTGIGSETFSGCGLKKVKLPKNIKVIGDYAFSNCAKLAKVKFPKDSHIKIGYEAFSGCGFKKLKLPNGSVDDIDSYAFASCSKLQSVKIGEGIAQINGYAVFYDCKLNKISLPVSLTSIGEGTFSQCIKLKNVFYPGTEEEWGKISIGNDNDFLLSAKMHYGK